MIPDFPGLLSSLAGRRPIFHSEADLQHELAWHLRETHRDACLRLEYPLPWPGNGAIDIVMRHNDQLGAVELKYLCKRIEAQVNNETFALKEHGAQDTRRYDVLKDISRMEQFIKHHPGAFASVIVLTNDPEYWIGPKREGTGSAAFSLREGRQLFGSLAWSEKAAQGTKDKREVAIELTGRYDMRWVKYSNVDAKFGKFGEFRFLHVHVR